MCNSTQSNCAHRILEYVVEDLDEIFKNNVIDEINMHVTNKYKIK